MASAAGGVQPGMSDGLPWWRSTPVRGALAVVGVLAFLFSVAMVVVFVGDLLGRGDGETEPGILVALVIFFIGTAAGGVFLVRANLRQPGASPRPANAQQRILQMAAVEQGRLTVPEVAAACQLSLDQAKAELDRLVVQEAASMEVTEDGVLVYHLHGFLSDEEKAAATDL